MADDATVWDLVGIPNPDHVELEDKNLADLYFEFSKQLHASDSLVVFADEIEFLSISEENHDLNQTKVKLLAALLRPTKRAVSKMRKVRHKSISYSIAVNADAAVMYPETHWLQLLDIYENFRNTRDYATLTSGTTQPRRLASLSSDSSFAPGITWFSNIDIFSFNKKWAIACFRGDCEESIANAFPWLVGFCSKKNLSRSLATLLTIKNYQCGAWSDAHNCEEGKIDDLVAACWYKYGDDEWHYGDFFLQFSDDQLNVFREQYGSLTSTDLIKDLERLRCEFDVDLYDLIGRFGPPINGNYLEDCCVKLAKEERDQQEEWERDRERAERDCNEAYAKLSAKTPEDFEADRMVDQLTQDELLALKKWMSDELDLNDVQVVFGRPTKYGHPMSWYRFSISFTDSKGTKHSEWFFKPFPSVRAAFNKALGAFYPGRNA